MALYTVIFQPEGISLQVPEGSSLLQAQITAGLHPDAPCGGKGTCGKCRVRLDGRDVLSCQTRVDRDMEIFTGAAETVNVLTAGL